VPETKCIKDKQIKIKQLIVKQKKITAMRRNYASPRLEVIEIEAQGVLCASDTRNLFGNSNEPVGISSFTM